MRRITAIASQKGGSGKTTTAVNLAAALAGQRRRVLVIDLDPQASASAWLSAAGTAAPAQSLLDVAADPPRATLPALIVPSVVADVDLLPASPALVGFDRALASTVGAELTLRAAFARLPQMWDHVVLDCPPSLGLLVVAALAAADDVVVPVESSVMALQGLAACVETIDRVRARLHPALALAGILLCRVDARTTLAREVQDQVRRRYPQAVLETVIRSNIRLAEAPSWHQDIAAYAPDSAGAADYQAAARELARRWARGSRKGR